MSSRFVTIVLGLIVVLGAVAADEPPDQPVVHAVIFYSPTCPHCHKVITETIIPLTDQYGDQLQVMGIDTSQTGGGQIYLAAVEAFDVPQERRGVPTLIVGERVLVGDIDIPAEFPAIIEQGLAGGGIDWPAIPGLEVAIAQMEAAEGKPVESTPEEAADNPEAPETAPNLPDNPAPAAEADGGSQLPDMAEMQPETLAARLGRDPVGNGLSVGVLIGMVVSVGAVVVDGLFRTNRAPSRSERSRTAQQRDRRVAFGPDWLFLLVCLVGIAVAAYLSFVEVKQVEAVCGPVGDCNTVQQSKYARLFGVLPVGVIGLAGYAAMLAVWAFGRWGNGRLAEAAPIILLEMALVGTLFSIYLTFLEPFVIGATCAWCLTSAVLMTVLLWMVAKPGWSALRDLPARG
jgi:uncharacterized membrane protein/thiol-disulfide isomerase/thioredoxin